MFEQKSYLEADRSSHLWSPSLGLARCPEEWTFISHWVLHAKVHTVCGKGMSVGGDDEKRCYQGRRESGPKIAVSKESFSAEQWIIRHDTKGCESQNKYW